MIAIGERRLVVGFSPVPEATGRLLAAVGRIARATGFQHGETLQATLANAAPAIGALIYAGQLQRVEIDAGDARVAIDICYYPDATEDDELQFANLSLLQITAIRLGLRLVVSSAEYARTLTADSLAASTDTISLELVEDGPAAIAAPAPADLPPGADYRIYAQLAPDASEVAGWVPGIPLAIDAADEQEFGSAGFGHISGKIRYRGGRW